MTKSPTVIVDLFLPLALSIFAARVLKLLLGVSHLELCLDELATLSL